MSYGITVENIDGNVIIDSTFRNFDVLYQGSKSPGDAYPGITGFDFQTDLLFAKPNRNTESTLDIAISTIGTPVWSDTSSSSFFPFVIPSSGWAYKTLRPLASGDTGYGFNIFNEDGDVCFSTAFLEIFNVLGAGSFVGGSSNGGATYYPSVNQTVFTFEPPSPFSINDVYVSINNFFYFEILNNYSYFYARYDYTNNRITLTTNTGMYCGFIFGRFVS